MPCSPWTSAGDVLAVSGAANLDGTLRATLTDDFQPRKDDSFIVLTYGSRAGEFRAVESTDPDRIAWRVDYAATGAVFDPATRQFRWTPTEAQGPGTYTATFRVTDHNPDAVNDQQLSATGEVSIAVNEVNAAPALDPVPDGMLHAGSSYTWTLNGSDPDLPVNTLTYSLVSGPEGATVDGETGTVTWSAPLDAAATVAEFTVAVRDNGVPPLFAERTFGLTVEGPVEILTLAREGGELGVTWRTIPGHTYRMWSSAALPGQDWIQAGETVTATEATATQRVPIGEVPGAAYLRVELLEP